MSIPHIDARSTHRTTPALRRELTRIAVAVAVAGMAICTVRALRRLEQVETHLSDQLDTELDSYGRGYLDGLTHRGN